jgi:hypothetical protein
MIEASKFRVTLWCNQYSKRLKSIRASQSLEFAALKPERFLPCFEKCSNTPSTQCNVHAVPCFDFIGLLPAHESHLCVAGFNLLTP